MNAARESWTAYAKREGAIVESPVPPANKFHARRTFAGRWFDSAKEARRFQELALLEAAGRIQALECQPIYRLYVMELYRSGGPIRITVVGRFTPDFRYTDCMTGEVIVEDVKSTATRTEAYKLRKRLVEAIHGIHVTEV